MYSFHGVGAESVESSLKTGQPPSQNHQNFPMEEKRGSAKKKKKKETWWGRGEERFWEVWQLVGTSSSGSWESSYTPGSVGGPLRMHQKLRDTPQKQVGLGARE